MPDIIIALYSDTPAANGVRTELMREGFAADRIDVTSLQEPGAAQLIPLKTGDRRFSAYFRTLLANSMLVGEVSELADRIDRGEAAVIVHPRGEVEVRDADEILERNHPKLIRRDVRESASPTPVVGENAAGKR